MSGDILGPFLMKFYNNRMEKLCFLVKKMSRETAVQENIIICHIGYKGV